MSNGTRSAIPTAEEGEKKFAPYIAATGRVVDAWNRLQETLKDVFAAVTKMPSPMAYAIWHSSRSDLSQRAMLRAAIRATRDNEPWVERLPRAKGDLMDLLRKADKLGEERNDAVHAPVSLSLRGGKLVIVPFYFNGNPRAVNLKNKDIVAEFSRLCDDAYALKDYAEKAEAAVTVPSRAWPDKPSLLIPPETQKRIRPSRRVLPEGHSTPPRSSQE
jgi:hypothetical protein